MDRAASIERAIDGTDAIIGQLIWCFIVAQFTWNLNHRLHLFFHITKYALSTRGFIYDLVLC